MAQTRMNYVQDRLEEVQENLETLVKGFKKSVPAELFEAHKATMELVDLLAAGRRERDKRERQRAKAGRLSTGAAVPLWED